MWVWACPILASVIVVWSERTVLIAHIAPPQPAAQSAHTHSHETPPRRRRAAPWPAPTPMERQATRMPQQPQVKSIHAPFFYTDHSTHTGTGTQQHTLAHPLRRALRRQNTRVAFFPASSRPPDSAPSHLRGGGLTCPPPFPSQGRAARRRRPSGSPVTASSGCRSAVAGSLASSGRRRSPRAAARCTARRRPRPPEPG